MSNGNNLKVYDLKERTFKFAKDVRKLVKSIHKNDVNRDDCKQVLRSSGSVGANYIEAGEAISRKDFLLRIKICRKEAKESKYWLELLSGNEVDLDNTFKKLINEANELTLIFGSIVYKV